MLHKGDIKPRSFLSTGGKLSPPGRDDELEGFTIGPDGKEAGNFAFWSALINGRGKHPGNEYPYLKSRLHIFTVKMLCHYSQNFFTMIRVNQTSVISKVPGMPDSSNLNCILNHTV